MAKATMLERSGFDGEALAEVAKDLKNMTPEQEEVANKMYRETFPEFEEGQYLQIAMNREAISHTCAALIETLLYQDSVHTMDDSQIITAVGTLFTTLIAAQRKIENLASMYQVAAAMQSYVELQAIQLYVSQKKLHRK